MPAWEVLDLTPRERLMAAFDLRQPDDIVPTFELQFQLAGELLGKTHVTHEQLDAAAGAERDRLIRENAELYVEEAERLDFSLIALSMGPWDAEDQIATVKVIKSLAGEKFMIAAMADGTMSIPSGSNMMELAVRLGECPDEVKAGLDRNATDTLDFARRMVDVGVEAFLMCADYCFNDGPFLSPHQFGEFVAPYLAQLIQGCRDLGFYVIKHTDGNIMPILDQLVQANPHALHSLDPQAGVDIAEVKRRCGDRLCLIGNVNCALLDTGTDEQVVESARYALKHGMPGGGYIFSTSNCIYTGMRLSRYERMLDVWRREGNY